jgi:hypothetical protein
MMLPPNMPYRKRRRRPISRHCLRSTLMWFRLQCGRECTSSPPARRSWTASEIQRRAQKSRLPRSLPDHQRWRRRCWRCTTLLCQRLTLRRRRCLDLDGGGGQPLLRRLRRDDCFYLFPLDRFFPVCTLVRGQSGVRTVAPEGSERPVPPVGIKVLCNKMACDQVGIYLSISEGEMLQARVCRFSWQDCWISGLTGF